MSTAGEGEVVTIVGGGQFPKITAKSTEDFLVGVTLGTGSFGRVRFATHKVGPARVKWNEDSTKWSYRIPRRNGQSKF